MFHVAGDTIVFSVKLTCAPRSRRCWALMGSFLGRADNRTRFILIAASSATGSVSDTELLPVIEASVKTLQTAADSTLPLHIKLTQTVHHMHETTGQQLNLHHHKLHACLSFVLRWDDLVWREGSEMPVLKCWSSWLPRSQAQIWTCLQKLKIMVGITVFDLASHRHHWIFVVVRISLWGCVWKDEFQVLVKHLPPVPVTKHQMWKKNSCSEYQN